LAGAGYSGAAGVGTPDGPGAFVAGSGAIETGAVGEQNGSDAGGGSGAAAVSDAGSDPPPATGRHRSHMTTVAGGRAVKLSDLKLTGRALAALRARRMSTTKVAFSFVCSRTSPVRITLRELSGSARRTDAARRARTRVLAGSFELVARKGRNRWRLPAATTLGPGGYRLTLAPAHGAARSLVIVVR
jgi:hypothetical protein